jgi:hypothetical protein
LHPRHRKTNVNDDDGEFGNLSDDDDMGAMDDMDILRPAKPESYYQEISQRIRERKK